VKVIMTILQKSARSAVLVSLLDIARKDPDPRLPDFAELLFGQAADEDLVAYDAGLLAQLAAATLRRIARRERGRHQIEIFDSPAEGETIIEILNDDMPFLVDSVMGELAETGCEVRLLLHPVLAVQRDATGALSGLGRPSEALPGSGIQRESLIQVHVSRIASSSWRKALAQRLDGVLSDVRQAVIDWRPMLNRLEGVIAAYAKAPPPLAPEEISEAVAFLEWLRDDNFLFLGMRAYAADPEGALHRQDESGLGVLRNPDIRVLKRGDDSLNRSEEMKAFLTSSRPLIVTKSNMRSSIHRRVPMDYIGVKLYGADGALTGELRMVGLFTSAAYTRSARSIPYLRHKINQALALTGFDPRGHSGKIMLNVLENLPRDEMFQIETDTLIGFALQIMALSERPRVRVLQRRDMFDRSVAVLVHVPRERYTTDMRVKIGDYLEAAFGGRVTYSQPTFLEGGLARIHVIVSQGEDRLAQVAQEVLEAEITEILRTWNDRFMAALARLPHREAEDLADHFGRAFGPAYRDCYTPETALNDARLLERLNAGEALAIDFFGREGAKRIGLKLYHRGDSVPLSDRVPVLENMGLRVIDEQTFRIEPQSRAAIFLHDMTLEEADGRDLVLDETIGARLEILFTAVWNRQAENDGFNRLALAAGLDWRNIAILRALARYLRQIGIAYGLDYMAEALRRNAGIAANIIRLFHARFDPAIATEERAARQAQIAAEIEDALEKVASLDDDTIIRRLTNLVDHTLRTNVYQSEADGAPRRTFAFKIDSRALTEMPQPRPHREIWVYGPRVEGVHLRFSPVARGGLRWSDRPQDFRTEVLGLVKAQQVKNAVIVPSGAKGGFLPRYLKPGMARDAWMAEGTEAYRIFVSSLITVTDNLDGETVVPPAHVVRHDGDDPYLVVAADKGTATFSDTANGIAMEAGFWLGDAFASGGSVGYDHKKMGITARGAFEAVKRHFREMDVDALATPITTIGVGDMSGDVFGNGMLLSRTLKLVAAFDHRDIFLDPNPDLDTALSERLRLFNLPRSSWADYDVAKISAGGGVFSRQAKVITLSPEIRAVLGITQEKVTPVELIRLILQAPVDLLWFGGIGTYVRASTESDAEAGDKANDVVRIPATALKVKVVGEGANLGMTQRARIEFGRAGGRCNSDAIDNSAGVNCSDVEVNIKIALTGAMAQGTLEVPARNPLLAAMTDEVAELVLANNRSQTLAIGIEWHLGAAELPHQARLMSLLEHSVRLDRKVEFLPEAREMERRRTAGERLTRSEIGVLLAYAKMDAKEALLASSLPDDPWLGHELSTYFPIRMRDTYEKAIASHRLRREIISTRLANAAIDLGGPSFLRRLTDETGASLADVVRAFACVDAVFGFRDLMRAIDRQPLSNTVAQAAYGRLRGYLRFATLWMLRNGGRGDLGALVARFAGGVADLGDRIEGFLPEARLAARREEIRRLIADGLEEAAARRLALMAEIVLIADACLVAETAGHTARGAALDAATERVLDVREGLNPDLLREIIGRVRPVDRYDALVLDRGLGQIDAALRAVAVQCLDAGIDSAAWIAQRREGAEKVAAMFDEVAAAPAPSVSAFNVLASTLADLAGA
jgi:glutamate dehydrogenase